MRIVLFALLTFLAMTAMTPSPALAGPAAVPVAIAVAQFLIKAIISFVIGLALNALMGAIMGKPSGFSPQPRTLMVREPAHSWKVIYGSSRVGSVIAFMASSSRNVTQANDPDDEGTEVLHLVLLLAAHEVDAITHVFFNDDLLEIAEDGEVLGKFAGHAFVYKHLGTADQAADASLMEWLPHKWTADHRLRGHAYLYVRLIHDPELYSGLPRISAVVRGRKIYDPRDGQTRWTDNSILIARDYLTDTRYGCRVPEADIDDDILSAQATICDERVDVNEAGGGFSLGPASDFTGYLSYQHETNGGRSGDKQPKTTPDAIVLEEGLTVDTGDPVLLSGTSLPTPLVANTTYYAIRVSNNVIENDTARRKMVIQLATSEANALAGTRIDITAEGTGTIATPEFIELADDSLRQVQTGDAVRLTSSGGTLPAPLSAGTDYYAIRVTNRRLRLATSAANARAGVSITVTTVGTGTMTMVRSNEPRYTCNGVFDTASKRDEILGALLGSCAGEMVFTSGKWRLRAGHYEAPEATIDVVRDATGPVVVQTLIGKREIFNSIKGTYWSPTNYDQPADFPAIVGTSYVAEDGVELWRDVSLPFTNSPSMAQRIAKISLFRAREQVAVSLPCTVRSAYALVAGETVALTSSHHGWDEKPFDIVDWKLTFSGDETGPVPGIELLLREASPLAYSWATDEEGEPPPVPNTNLPGAFERPLPPGHPSIEESLYQSQPGAGLKTRVTLTWAASPTLPVARYEVQHRGSGETDWIAAAPTTATTIQIDDVPDGAREFRVRAVARRGMASHWTAVVVYTVIGLSEPPEAPTGFSLRPLNGQGHLVWDRHPALDVRIGGRFEVRHAPVLTGATWATASPLATEIAGQATEATVPLATGTYLMKAVDSAGNESESPASVVTTLPDLLHWNVVETLTEHPAWSGTKTGCEVDGSSLVLSTESLVDDWDDWDDIEDFDAGEGFQSSGTYRFGPVDLGQVYPVRLRAHLVAAALVLGTTIDERTDPIDTWEDIDGASSPNAPVSARLWVRATDDDPAGTPAWGAWIPFLATDLVGRGFEFDLRLESADTNVGVQVSECEIVLDMPDRLASGDATTSAAGETAISFSPAFKAVPAKPSITIQSGATGDYVQVSSLTRSGFDLSVRDAGGSRVARDVSWYAKGYGIES